MRWLPDVFEQEVGKFNREVRERAAHLVRNGDADPVNALGDATRQIMAERKARARNSSIAGLAVLAAKKR